MLHRARWRANRARRASGWGHQRYPVRHDQRHVADWDHTTDGNWHGYINFIYLWKRAGRSYVLTTGTGSGKSLRYFIPIVDRALRHGKGEPRITAIVVYPMNALCNSQLEELKKFLEAGYPERAAPRKVDGAAVSSRLTRRTFAGRRHDHLSVHRAVPARDGCGRDREVCRGSDSDTLIRPLDPPAGASSPQRTSNHPLPIKEQNLVGLLITCPLHKSRMSSINWQFALSNRYGLGAKVASSQELTGAN